MPDAARLEQQHAPAVAREVVGGREPHQAASHDDDVMRHPAGYTWRVMPPSMRMFWPVM